MLLESILIAVQIIYALGWLHSLTMFFLFFYGLWFIVIYFIWGCQIITLSGCRRATFLTIEHCSGKGDITNEHPYISMLVLRANKCSWSKIWRNKNKNMIRTLHPLFCNCGISRCSIYVSFYHGFPFLMVCFFSASWGQWLFGDIKAFWHSLCSWHTTSYNGKEDTGSSFHYSYWYFLWA